MGQSSRAVAGGTEHGSQSRGAQGNGLDEQAHRKTKRTFNKPGHAHFLTCSCHGRLPLLAKDRTRQFLVEALNEVRQKFDVAIFAYVIMPEHMHCLLRPRQREYDMAPIVAAIKTPVSSRAKAHLIETGQTRWLERLTVTQGQRTVFRFWLAGGGHDRNLWNDKPIHKTVEYIHMNPVRRGLVTRPEDWEWSSARFWAGIRPVPLEMDQVR